jgi:asparagine synthase (glutamine-hydrolysing)
LTAAGVPMALNNEALFMYLGYGLVEQPDDIAKTFYHGIKRLAPATWMTLRADGTMTQRVYWQLDPDKQRNDLTEEKAAEELTAMLRDAVNGCMHADTDVGTTVSGGIDSSTILALMRAAKHNEPIETFTARIHDKKLDEGPYVATLLQRVHANNHEAWVDEGVLIQVLDDVLKQQEEPVADLTVLAQEQVMRAAADRKMKVLLDGQGADEILADESATGWTRCR